MHLYDGLRSSLQSIFSHKMRSILTLMGIVIGVMAVVTMFSSIYGLKTLISSNMEGMGWNRSVLVTAAGAGFNMGQDNSEQKAFKKTNENVKALDIADYEALKSQLDLKSIYGMIEERQNYLNKQKLERVSLKATNTSFFINKSYNIKSGHYFRSFESQYGEKVCILGYYFAQSYFKNTDPLGQYITVGEIRYRVVGVLQSDKLNKAGMDFNSWERKNDLKAVYIPLETGAKYLRSHNAVDYIYLQAKDDATFAPLKNRARQILLVQRGMYQNFDFQNIGAFLLKITKEINSAFQKWNITLFAIASISLIVGGIGLFSTLLISINERMMEIGIRKSVGATEGDIFFYFIMEAITLAALGALFGIIIASGLLKIVSALIHMSLPIPAQGIMIGIGFSLLIGFLSGLYPALKAAKINPIQAIFYFE
jgi:putative ABC transport system permease protein